MDIAYALEPVGQTDPGEIIRAWPSYEAWVPYEASAEREEATFSYCADEARRHSG